jgi:thiamine-monophosphate kinase
VSYETPLGPGKEFDLIRAMLARWGDRARGNGDDTVLVDVPNGERLVVSTDTSVENVHFRREWLSAREIGYRATAAALSDLAAAAAAPLGVLVALTLPPPWVEHALEIADGIGEAVAESETHIIGGDLSGGVTLSLGVTVLGHAAEPLRRVSAGAGDSLYVTGRLGGPFAALRAWKAGEFPSVEARARFAHPEPRLREARWLREHGARAAIDISDGLLGDAAHIAKASGATLILELDSLRVVADVSHMDAARSGEEYELLVAAPPHLDVSAFEREFHLPLTPIGRVQAGPPEVHAMLNGVRVAASGGFSHFS